MVQSGGRGIPKYATLLRKGRKDLSFSRSLIRGLLSITEVQGLRTDMDVVRRNPVDVVCDNRTPT